MFDGGLVDLGEGRFTARTDHAFWNQIGPYGGWIAALSMHAMRQGLPAALAPRSFSCTLVDAVRAGEFELQVNTVARRRTLEVHEVRLSQQGRVCAFAQCVFGAPREQPSLVGEVVPPLPAPEQLGGLPFMSPLANFVNRFDYRLASGSAFGGGGAPSRSAGYVRLRSRPRRLGPEDLLLLADAWFPALWTQTRAPVPATTVTMSVVFHCEDIPEPTDGFVLLHVASSEIRDGYADETTELWVPGGPLLLKSVQLLWVNFQLAHKASSTEMVQPARLPGDGQFRDRPADPTLDRGARAVSRPESRRS